MGWALPEAPAEASGLGARRLGELLAETPKASGGDRRSEDFKSPKVGDLKARRQEVNYHLSSRSQALASLPEPVFEQLVSKPITPSAAPAG